MSTPNHRSASSGRVEHLADGVSCYLGDCREILPTLGKVDAVVTDPPYGQDYKVNTFYAGGTRENAVVQRNGKTLVVSPTTYEPIIGDDRPFDPSHLLELAPELLIFGAHKFADRLPPGGWLVWDKVPTGKVRDQGDGEAGMAKPRSADAYLSASLGRPLRRRGRSP
jgi:site-specific DNA-methyltransferase (adenine-specific)/modification methylase